MPPELRSDPIAQSYRMWVDRGWGDSAEGHAAVASIVNVHRVLTKTADELLAPLKLTSTRYAALVTLYFDDQGSMPLARLAENLGIHQTTITSLVDKLEEQGLIERAKHPTDRRTTIARLTPAGQALARKAIRRLNSELFSKLALSQEEARQLIVLLGRLRQSWGESAADASWDGIFEDLAPTSESERA